MSSSNSIVTDSPVDNSVVAESPTLYVVGRFIYSPLIASKFKYHNAPLNGYAPPPASLIKLKDKDSPGLTPSSNSEL